MERQERSRGIVLSVAATIASVGVVGAMAYAEHRQKAPATTDGLNCDKYVEHVDTDMVTTAAKLLTQATIYNGNAHDEGVKMAGEYTRLTGDAATEIDGATRVALCVSPDGTPADEQVWRFKVMPPEEQLKPEFR